MLVHIIVENLVIEAVLLKVRPRIYNKDFIVIRLIHAVVNIKDVTTGIAYNGTETGTYIVRNVEI